MGGLPAGMQGIPFFGGFPGMNFGSSGMMPNFAGMQMGGQGQGQGQGQQGQKKDGKDGK